MNAVPEDFQEDYSMSTSYSSPPNNLWQDDSESNNFRDNIQDGCHKDGCHHDTAKDMEYHRLEEGIVWDNSWMPTEGMDLELDDDLVQILRDHADRESLAIIDRFLDIFPNSETC